MRIGSGVMTREEKKNKTNIDIACIHPTESKIHKNILMESE
jgi:hypothetical protein